MNITLGQFEPILGDKTKNLQKMKEIMEEAAGQNSNLVLFPELCLTGYFIQDLEEDMSEPIDGPSIQYMQELCKKLKLHTVFSWAERGEDGHVYNSACLISHEGKVIGNYRKIHVYGREKEVFKRGDTFNVFDTKFGRIGIMICYDLDFPESARILNLKNADIILIPTNNFYPYERYQRTYMKSRAMENEIPIAICNRTGQEQDLKYFGESAIYDAHGYPLVQLDDSNVVKTAEVSINKETDNNLSYKQNRIPSTYKKLIIEDE